MTNEAMLDDFSELITESYRLKKAFERLVRKTDFSEQARYVSQISWYDKRLLEITANVGLKIVIPAGEKYDEGMAVTPLNLDEFDKSDVLFIEQVLEPIIMFNNKILRMGTAILRRGI